MSKGVIPTYEEINRDLQSGVITKERAIELAQQRKRLDDLSANLDLAGEWGRQILGAGITAAGAIPIFRSPGVGGAVGGGLAGLGSGIQHHHSGKQLAKDVGIGVIDGAIIGGVMGRTGGTVASKVAPNIIKNASKGVNKVAQNMPRIQQSTPVKNFNQRLTQNKINTKPAEISVEEFLNSQPKYETEIMTHYSPNKINSPYELNRVGENMGQTTGKGMFVTNNPEYGIGSYALTKGNKGFANEYEVPLGKYGIQADLPLNQQPQHVQNFVKKYYQEMGYTPEQIVSEMQFRDGYQFVRKGNEVYGDSFNKLMSDSGIPLMENPSQLERQIFDEAYMQAPIRVYPVSEENLLRYKI